MKTPCSHPPLLLCLSGLPGEGKSTLARAYAAETGAIWLRIDSFEIGLRRSVLQVADLADAGYRAAAEVAVDLLGLGHDVILDAVNPAQRSRVIWDEIPTRIPTRMLNVEIRCSCQAAHRARIENRHAQDPARSTWADVEARHWEPWPPHVPRIDTHGCSVKAALAALHQAIATHAPTIEGPPKDGPRAG